MLYFRLEVVPSRRLNICTAAVILTGANDVERERMNLSKIYELSGGRGGLWFRAFYGKSFAIKFVRVKFEHRTRQFLKLRTVGFAC